jgi:integrase/recombinase XerD
VSEALGLEVDNIDFKSGTVTIQHLKTSIRLNCPKCSSRLSHNSIYCSGCGTKVEQAVNRAVQNRKMRTLPVDRETMAMMREFIRKGGPVVKNGKMLIFGINRHRAWQILRTCGGRAGLPRLVNTDDSGDGLRLLQQHLGHASFNTTARYRKISGEESRRWYDHLWEKGK